MCGIFGIADFSERGSANENLLKEMSSSLEHRGPDGESLLTTRRGGIGARRLRVMSRYAEHVPAHNEDSSIWAVVDGQICNREQLRSMLGRCGHHLSTLSDEEMLAHLYEEFGHQFPSRVNGLFTFAIWDQRAERLVLGGDHVASKPLYYMIDTKRRRLAFASGIRAILRDAQVKRKIDVIALRDYMTYGFVPAPQSIFEGIAKVLPGQVILWDQDGCIFGKYWDLRFLGPCVDVDYPRALYDLLKECVRRQVPDERPVGLFLSGGLDSSTIVGLTSELIGGENLKTFSVGFQESSYNELDYARCVAEHFGTDHHEVVMKPGTVDLVDELVCYLDEPLADWSVFPTFLVSRLAKSEMDTVLSGDAADDLFAGHERLLADRMDSYYRKLPGPVRDVVRFAAPRLPDSAQQRGPLNVLKRFVQGANLPLEIRDCRWWTCFNLGEEDRILHSRVAQNVAGPDPYRLVKDSLSHNDGPDLLSRELYVSLLHLSQGIRAKVDRMSMANSLQVRTPFLDRQFVEFAMRIPSSMKIRGLNGKWILKKSMLGLLPKRIITKPKRGFTIPMKVWLRGDLRGKLEHTLSATSIRRNGYLNPDYVCRLVSEHLAERKDNSHKLWRLMMFMIWHSEFTDESTSCGTAK